MASNTMNLVTMVVLVLVAHCTAEYLWDAVDFQGEAVPDSGYMEPQVKNLKDDELLGDEDDFFAGIIDRMVNGEHVDRLRDAPYVVSIYMRAQGKDYFVCSGVAVAKDIAFTAAHCMEKAGTYKVCGGVLNMQKLDAGSKGGCSEVKRYKIPMRYTEYTKGYDVAVAQTKDNLTKFGVEIAKVSFTKNYNAYPDFKEGYGMGFGVTNVDGNGFDKRMRHVAVWIFKGRIQEQQPFPADKYIAAWGDFNGSMGGTCSGDSGGPLVQIAHGSIRKTPRHVVVGVLSFGFSQPSNGRCIPQLPSMYSNFGDPITANFLKKCVKKWGRELKIVS